MRIESVRSFLGVLLACAMCASTHAQVTTPVIEKAQKMLLAGERTKAIESLVAAIKKETNTKNRNKLRTALAALSREFLTEQGQKLYHVGLTFELSNPPISIQKLTEALAQEDMNDLVVTALARAQLTAKKCQDAKTTLAKELSLNPYSVEASELNARALLCLGEREALRNEIRFLEKEEVAAWRVKWLKAQEQMTEVPSINSHALLEQITHESTGFPEPYFYLWKSAKPGSDRREDMARRYVLLCKSLSQQAKQDYRFEPDLCMHVDELQSELERQQKHLDEESEK